MRKANFSFLRFCLAFSIITVSWDLWAVDVAGFTLRLTQLFILPVIVSWFFNVLRTGHISFPLGGAYLVIWVIMQFMFVFRSPNLKNAIGYFLWLCFNIIGVFSISYFIEVAYSTRWLLRIYILSYVFASIEGILQFLLSRFGIHVFVTQRWNESLIRINGFTFEPSYFATYILIGFVFISYLLEVKNSYLFSLRVLKIFYFLIFLVLILSSSRMGWLMAGVWIVFRLILQIKRISSGMKKKKFVSLLFLTAFVSLFAFFIIPEYLLGHRFLIEGLGILGSKSHSSADRINGLLTCVRIFINSPLIGYSLGGVDPMIAKLRHSIFIGNGAAMSVAGEALAANGVIGLIPFLSYLKELIFKKRTGYISRGLIYSLVLELIILCMNQNILRPYLWMHIAILSAEYRSQVYLSKENICLN